MHFPANRQDVLSIFVLVQIHRSVCFFKLEQPLDYLVHVVDRLPLAAGRQRILHYRWGHLQRSKRGTCLSAKRACFDVESLQVSDSKDVSTGNLLDFDQVGALPDVQVLDLNVEYSLLVLMNQLQHFS